MARLSSFVLAIAAAGVVSLTAGAHAVRADDTGLASMHEWKRVGRLTCYAEHTHYGSSVGHRDKKSATAAAIKDWAEFTAWEYGTVWANFNKATAKKIACAQSPSGWGCDIEARPCR